LLNLIVSDISGFLTIREVDIECGMAIISM
jgi:hypothetical protein